MKTLIAVLGLFLLGVHPVVGLLIPTYTTGSNDRFSSGYPTAPVINTSSLFAGLGYDFSGVGWAAVDSGKSFAMLTPKNFLAAEHYGGAPTIDFLGGDGQLHQYSQVGVVGTNYGVVFSGDTYGDLAVGTLTTPIKASDQIQTYAVLDMPSYANASLMLYGHQSGTSTSPRVAMVSASSVVVGTGTDPSSYILTATSGATLEGGDSGSPTFIPWTDPSGAKQLTIIGNNAAVSNYNWLNFIPRAEDITALNSAMVGGGYALRWVANATMIWKGGYSGNAFNSAFNWSTYSSPTSSSYIGLSSTNSSYLSLDLGGGTQPVRGVNFNPGTAGFTLSNGTLSLGRGGLDNYDTHVQTLNNNFMLTDDQYWDGHSGGFNVAGSINTNGNLLIVQGSAASTLSGAISGSGSFAKDGAGILTVSGSNSYSGPTFLHNGTLVVSNTAGSGTGLGTLTVEAGKLAGFGIVAGSASIAAGAHVFGGKVNVSGAAAPDSAVQANNILTIGGDLVMDGALDFYLGNLSELSGYTQLVLSGTASRLTLGADSSFSLATGNFVGVSDPNSGLPFWNSAHVWTLVEVMGATQVSGVFGDVSLGTWSQGSFSLTVSTSSAINAVQLAYSPVPEPSAALLLLAGAAFCLRRRSLF